MDLNRIPKLLPLLGLLAACFSPTVCFLRPATSQEPFLELPPGFQVQLIAKKIGRIRHIVVRKNGDIYARLRTPSQGGTIVALRDENGDGKVDVIQYFESEPGTGIDFFHPYLYYSTDTQVFRRKFKNDQELVPSGKKEIVVGGFPSQRGHAAKAFCLDPKGNLYVNVGAPSNACQKEQRTPGSPGRNPCSELKRHAGIWQFPAFKTGLDQMRHGIRYASGLRNIVALDWNVDANDLFVVQHGRDQLSFLFPKFYSVQDNAQLPAEEMLRVTKGFLGGWPYTYWDGRMGKRILAPEYGGDGKKEAPAGKYPKPVWAFGAHYAPNDLLFYRGKAFPKHYWQGAFIAFHGSWNRAPLPQRGYHVVFLPFKKGVPNGKEEVFADGFSGQKLIRSPSQAKHRPMGLGQDRAGNLYIGDSVRGYLWKIAYASKQQ